MGGLYSSALGWSVDGENSILVTYESPTFAIEPIASDSERVTVTVRDSSFDERVAAPILYKLGAWGPIIGNGDSLPVKRVGRIAQAYSRSGDSALVAVSRIRGSVDTLALTCIDDRGIVFTCYRGRYYSMPDTAYLYSVSTIASNPTLNLLRVLPDTIIYSIAFTESGDSTFVTWGGEADTIDADSVVRHQLWCKLEIMGPRLSGSKGFSAPSLEACPPTPYYFAGVGGLTSVRTPSNRSIIGNKRLTPKQNTPKLKSRPPLHGVKAEFHNRSDATRHARPPLRPKP